jgi:hypothetical protein
MISIRCYWYKSNRRLLRAPFLSPRDGGGPGLQGAQHRSLCSRVGGARGAVWLRQWLNMIAIGEISPHMTRRTAVRLPEGLLGRARRKAAAERRTLTSLIEDGLQLVVSEYRNPGKSNRVLPRVSRASGGPMPGLEINDFSALQEMDELDSIRRASHRSR